MISAPPCIFNDLRPPQEVGAKAAARVLARIGAKKAKTGTFPVIYDQRVSATISGPYRQRH